MKFSRLGPGVAIGVDGRGTAVAAGVDVAATDAKDEQNWLSRKQALSASSFANSNLCSRSLASPRRLNANANSGSSRIALSKSSMASRYWPI